MKWLGYKKVALKSLRLDAADIRKRTKAAHVADLADDIRKHGEEPIHAPTIRMPGKELLCGRDRVAALLTLKAKRLWVRLCECSDVEAADLEASENIHRRADNRNEVLARAVIVKERLLAAQEGRTVSRAPQSSAKAQARKEVARAAGVSTAAVKKAEQRAARKNSGGGSDPAAETPSAARRESAASSPSGSDMASSGGAAGAANGEDVQPPTLDLLGIDDASTRAIDKFARPDREAIDKADQLLRQAQTALAGMTPSGRAQELKAQVHRVAELVRSNRPHALCPWCKGLPGAHYAKLTGGACTPCAGFGYVSEEVLERAPRELREQPLVAVHGKFIPYADALGGNAGANGKPAKREKKISAVGPDGNEIDLDAVG